MRVANAEQALEILSDDDVIWCQSMAATPYKLLQGLAEVALQRSKMTLLQLHTEHSDALFDPCLQGYLRQRAFFVGKSTRSAVNEGLADYVPIFLSEIPKLFRSGEQPLDAVLIQVSAPDAHGNCSLGISVEATRAALQVAKKVIASVTVLKSVALKYGMSATLGNGIRFNKQLPTFYSAKPSRYVISRVVRSTKLDFICMTKCDSGVMAQA